MSDIKPALPADMARQVEAALAEDLGFVQGMHGDDHEMGKRDLTAALVPATQQAEARLVAREAAVIAGQPWVEEVFRQLDPEIHVDWRCAEGEQVAADTEIAVFRGPARSLLTGERTALNFLQTLSGTATVARHYAGLVEGTGCRILDTRKTLPGLRTAQKYAVAVGGCTNHRTGLHDAILIKENHIAAAGGIAAAVRQARATAPQVTVEVEVENLDELQQALAAAADIVMLDNFSLADTRTAVTLARAASDRVKLEASGNVEENRLRELADTGVDFISVGALTKHVRAVDLSLRFAIRTG